MRALLLLIAAVALAHAATVLTRADQASIDAALPILQRHLPDVRVIPADPTQWRGLIDRGGVDFLWAGAPLLYESLLREGYLAPMPDVPELREMPERAGGVPLKRVGPDGRVYYVVYALLGYVIGYSGEALAKAGVEPACSWADLASPNLTLYFIKTGSRPVALARPTKSTSTAAMMQLVTEIYGWDEGWRLLTAMAAHARFVDSSGAVRDAVRRGEALFGPMVDYYVFLAGLDYCIPRDGTDVLFDPIAVPRGANATAAAVLTRVFLSEVEKRLVDRYILPGNLALLDSPDVNRTKAALLKRHLEKLMASRVLAVPPEKSASYYHSFIYYYEATLVDLQDQLASVWGKTVEAYHEGKISRQQFERLWRLIAAPLNYTDPATGEATSFTYQVAAAINDRVARDPAYRDKLIQAWREAARERYRRAEAELESLLNPPRRPTPAPYAVAAAVALALAATIFYISRKRKIKNTVKL
ncbi:ABC transporter substrate-binding protein [Pyrobaculum neutrophilum]|uniref:Extracellular solute-binding protein family 1 n=1 Tax=Pyrobaculum neutrophilum (strain DSM 2338 / JCM 9278 / NBRC 100436 / V24Sta) TaxID=444157 RepID=B1YDL7_PYRNV|nr:ABC transporter substrate-binding protein [Pyrobaculum neutrophilum]ACB39880.1 conserved hypothetical protein [Pyrobaculum neutrophilum V24Sta]